MPAWGPRSAPGSVTPSLTVGLLHRFRFFSASLNRSHESPFVLSEALCFFVMFGGREALGIVRDFAAVGFISLDGGKAKQRNRDIVGTFFTDAGKTKRRRG